MNGRRWGKTTLGIDRLIEAGMQRPVAWMSPTYRMLTEVWYGVCDTLKPITARVSAQQHRIELVSGGVIEMWSMEQPDAIRGRKYARVVIDEAAMTRDLGRVWQQVIRPTLTDFQGDAWLLSSPRGRNFFWQCWQRGQSGDAGWRSWQMPTASNPHIAASEIEALRHELPELTYRQEIEAQFLEEHGSVFRRVYEAATAEPHNTPEEDHTYVIGADWARAAGGDSTVFVVMDATTRTMVAMERLNGVAYRDQRARLQALYEHWQPHTIIAELNSIGGPVVEQLQRDGLPVQGVTTTNSSKAAWVDGFALALERDEVRLLNDAVLIGELLAFEGQQLPSGLMRYSAPPGQHDDCVMALLLAYQGVTESGELFLW